MEQAPGTPWSDLPVAATNKAAGGISFSFASDVPFPGSRPIDTPDVPKAGYVSWAPDLEVTEVHDVQSTPLPAVGGRQDGVRGFRVRLTGSDGERLAAMTATNVGRRLVVFVGADPVMAPVVTMPLMSGTLEIQCRSARASERLDQVLRTMRRRER